MAPASLWCGAVRCSSVVQCVAPVCLRTCAHAVRPRLCSRGNGSTSSSCVWVFGCRFSPGDISLMTIDSLKTFKDEGQLKRSAAHRSLWWPARAAAVAATATLPHCAVPCALSKPAVVSESFAVVASGEVEEGRWRWRRGESRSCTAITTHTHTSAHVAQ